MVSPSNNFICWRLLMDSMEHDKGGDDIDEDEYETADTGEDDI